MQNLSLRTKLILAFAIPIGLLIIVAIVGIITVNGVRANFLALSETSLPLIEALDELKFAGSRLISSANEFVVDKTLGLETESEAAEGEGGERAEIESAVQTYHGALDTYRTLVVDAASHEQDDVELFGAVEAAGQELLDASDAILWLIENDAVPSELVDARAALEAAEDTYLAAIGEALEEEEDELAASQSAVDAAVNTSLFSGLSIAGVALVLTFGAVVYLFQSIVRPINNLKGIANRLREGNLTVRSDNTSGDEIGQFAATFNSMASAIEYRDQVQIAKLETQLGETEAARLRAERSEQVKAAFLASMSHELRTPLNAVINFTRFVVEGDTGPVNEQQVELLTEVVNSAKHLLNLINDVLDMSKIEAGSLNLFIENDIDLNNLLNNVVSTGRALLGDKPIRLQLSVDEHLPLLRGDRQRILQILLNIMSNACKFTEAGEITVSAQHSGDEIVISVTDTGPGIAPEDQSLVFEAFKQTQAGLRQGGGTGLGMPIARSLTEAHGGRLWLNSEPGKGATFSVSLPINSEELMPAMVS